MHGIYHAYTIHIEEIYVVYTEKLDSITQYMYDLMMCIFFVYTDDIPKLNMEILHAGQGHRTSLVQQTVSSTCLDAIDGLQCSDIISEGRAASMEFTGYTSPHLFPLSTSEGLRTSAAEYLSTSHSMLFGRKCKLSHISTAADRGTLLSAAVRMVLALP